ncbi:hypothetical protein HN681_02710 [archaeon]|jgi:hypothetical protein|nr:hypothetical protein [archaeon]MBT3731172.1 hypothetical protein [archaeon]MBT4670074.1 hypothetical protein [archaeon]MBT5030626.1 hypothetical protein [archaeon]MBT5287978.1 hypothetical protein [archaeon]
MEIKELFAQKGLVQEYSDLSKILSRKSQKIKIFYGETYDDKGNTIDSIKYYFFVANLAYCLKNMGFNVEPIILIADTAACRNIPSKLKEKFIEIGKDRLNFVKKINEIYKTDLRIELMSDYNNTPEFKKNLDLIKEICNSNEELMKDIEKTVPPSKIEIEREKEFAYSFEEIATIIDLDIKVGPPREKLYDIVANKILTKLNKKELLTAYLTPTFPLGLDFDYFIAHEDIEEHGITAYKAASKRLQDNRILIGKTNLDSAKKLITDSFISKNQNLPNPILDIGIISEMAAQRLNGQIEAIKLHDQFYLENMDIDKFKEEVYNLLSKNILEQFEVNNNGH